ncbi:mediator of RNA polymerase II transcription subunit 11-like [Echinops telfairi]|uniref:Mediator of RNA polymerase II transcription subunit 11-like n=1 Tax=Echinops telfairi TaxID=9371 RepID=A0AC55DGS9_ECHTE|nr:mediator of RNA polymerase II transcription subunit 11-like [Echinops telfairi]
MFVREQVNVKAVFGLRLMKEHYGGMNSKCPDWSRHIEKPPSLKKKEQAREDKQATYSLANEQFHALEDIEREVGAILQNAGNVILELSKEKTNERLLHRQTAAFTASVQHVEAELSAQIRYRTQVATGQPHEGSSYSSRKDCQMALKQVDYARLKLSDVARTCEQMLEN